MPAVEAEQCPWKIRLLSGQNTQCEKQAHVPAETPVEVMTEDEYMHQGIIRDYAYPGSETKINWYASDRREFTGDWPGVCTKTWGCTLPAGHHRECAR